MKLITQFSALLGAVLLSRTAMAQCLEYEPKVVNLTGTLVREIHPGPPNYESIPDGDKPETIWDLKLNSAICVLSSGELNAKENNETEVQLVLKQEQYNQNRNLLGQNVKVSGKLFHSHTGHHHKRLLLTTSEIKKTAPHAR